MSLEPLAEIELEEEREASRPRDLGIHPPVATAPTVGQGGALGIAAIAITLALVGGSAIVGLSFWSEWFASADRILCTIFAALGFLIALLKCSWGSDLPPRKAIPGLLWGASALMLAIAVSTGRSKLAGVSMGLAVAAWLCYRIRGESIVNALSLGMVFMIPSFVDACKDRNLFQASEGVALKIASGLSDATGQSHLSENGGILFGHGFFDQFACEGRWDSIISYIGISCFCIYAFRRNLLAGLITLSLAFTVWMAVRGTACVAFAQLAAVNGVWPEWNFTTECILFIIGALLLFSLDNFFGVLLKPIPIEHVNPDFPLFALSWNWLTSLPNLTVEVPERLADTATPEDFE